MKKGAFRGILSLVWIVTVLFLAGCADTEILTEILQTAAIETEAGGTEGMERDAGLQPEESRTTEEGTSGEDEEADGTDAEKEDQETGSGYQFLSEEASCFAYQSLKEAEQIWYHDIAESLGAMEEKTRLTKSSLESGLDETDVDRIFQCVLLDHPELFYVEGYTYTKYNRSDKIIAIDFSGAYSMNPEQALSRQKEIGLAVQPLLAGAEGLATDYDKVKYVYETIITSTDYDLTAPDNQNIYSVFVNHRSVCQGYAKAVQYLLERMGVECALVQGSVDTGEGHAWNLVKVDGSYYYVDATWGDASYQPDEEETAAGYYVPDINYDYLCVTTQQLLRTHILDSYVPMPVCEDTKDNYYVHEGALFTDYDREQMKQLFERAVAEGRQDVTVKCSNAECFRRILTAMVDGQEIFDYLPDDSDTVVYAHNEKQLSMTFWVTNE